MMPPAGVRPAATTARPPSTRPDAQSSLRARRSWAIAAARRARAPAPPIARYKCKPRPSTPSSWTSAAPQPLMKFENSSSEIWVLSARAERRAATPSTRTSWASRCCGASKLGGMTMFTRERPGAGDAAQRRLEWAGRSSIQPPPSHLGQRPVPAAFPLSEARGARAARRAAQHRVAFETAYRRRHARHLGAGRRHRHRHRREPLRAHTPGDGTAACWPREPRAAAEGRAKPAPLKGGDLTVTYAWKASTKVMLEADHHDRRRCRTRRRPSMLGLHRLRPERAVGIGRAMLAR